MPNVADLDKDALAALIKQLYEQSCSVYADKFNMEHEVRKENKASRFKLRIAVQ